MQEETNLTKNIELTLFFNVLTGTSAFTIYEVAGQSKNCIKIRRGTAPQKIDPCHVRSFLALGLVTKSCVWKKEKAFQSHGQKLATP